MGELAQQAVGAGVSKVLIAEDDLPLSNFLQTKLSSDNLSVDVAYSGDVALQKLQAQPYDLLLLDLNLPELDGLSLLRRIRPIRPNLPVLVLTGLSTIEERVLALDTGADDYLSKPFSFYELAARTRALLRRGRGTAGRQIHLGDLFMDRDQMRVERAGRRVPLSCKEFSVLECLMANAGKPVSRNTIMETVWNAPFDDSSNLVDVYVKYVRDKVDGNSDEKLIHTVRGVGYVVAQNRNMTVESRAEVLMPLPHQAPYAMEPRH
jgi:DNA-binding response OmpR family regulator